MKPDKARRRYYVKKRANKAMRSEGRAASRATAAVVAAFSSMLAFPALAFASEAEEESGGISAILPDMMEFIPMLIAFIILWIILAKFGWPMFNGMLEKRENTIREALKKSEEAKVESERVLAEYKEQLADAKAQAAKIVSEARETGEAVKADIQAKAQQEAADMIEKAKSTIEAEKKAAIAELQASIADTSVDVAAKLIGNDLTEGEHRAIIEKYVKEAGSFNGN